MNAAFNEEKKKLNPIQWRSENIALVQNHRANYIKIDIAYIVLHQKGTSQIHQLTKYLHWIYYSLAFHYLHQEKNLNHS